MSEILEAVLELPEFDTHTHLNNPGVPIMARTFWDIGEYFWFKREWFHDSAERRYVSLEA